MSRAPNSQPSNRRPLAAASDVPAATTPSASAERARQGRAMLWIGLCLIAVGAALVPVLILLPTPERAAEARSMTSMGGLESAPSRARASSAGPEVAAAAAEPLPSAPSEAAVETTVYGGARAAAREQEAPSVKSAVVADVREVVTAAPSESPSEPESEAGPRVVESSQASPSDARGVGASRALGQLSDASRALRTSFKSAAESASLAREAWTAWVDARIDRVLRVAFDAIELDRACKADVDASPLWKDAPDDAVEQLEPDGGFLFLWNPPKERRSRPSPERVRAWSELAEQLNEERIVLQRAFKTEGAFQEELERRARALAEQTIPDERERALLLRSEPWLMLTERRLELERGRIARYLKEATP